MAAKSGSGDAVFISHSGAAIEEAMIHSSVNYIYVKTERWRQVHKLPLLYQVAVHK